MALDLPRNAVRQGCQFHKFKTRIFFFFLNSSLIHDKSQCKTSSFSLRYQSYPSAILFFKLLKYFLTQFEIKNTISKLSSFYRIAQHPKIGFTDGRRLILDVKMEKKRTHFRYGQKNFNCALQSYFCEKNCMY